MTDDSPRSSDGFLAHLARGLLMGGSDIIPGVSGGTMALILGIYERLIDALSSLASVAVSVLRADAGAVRRHWRAVEWRLLVPLGLGILLAIGLGATVVLHLIETYPHQSQGLFLGLVAASLAIPWMRLRDAGLRELGVGVAAAVLAYLLTGLPPSNAGAPSLGRVFFSAAVAICAMILPGVSGAFLLKAMGLYETTLGALHGAAALHGPALAYVATFCLGAAAGLGSFSKLLDWLLDHHHNITMAALLGLMAGALRALWPWQTALGDLRGPAPGEPVLTVVALMALGIALVAALTWWGLRLAPEDEGPDAAGDATTARPASSTTSS